VKLKKSQQALLKHARVARVATTGPDGAPHVVPICPVSAGGNVYFGTDGSSRKVRNLERNPRIAIVVDDYSEDWSRLYGLLLTGRAELLRSGAEVKRVRKLLAEKFPQYKEERYLEAPGSVIVRITPEKLFSWGL
jgi:PPOX class probable F420-dependent enzyme